jgi:hypothetical protein
MPKKWVEVADEYDKSQTKSDDENEETTSDSSDDSKVINIDNVIMDALKNIGLVNSSKNPKLANVEFEIKELKPAPKNIIKKSVANFDYEEIHELDKKNLSKYDTNMLLQILMVRGIKNHNPVLFHKSKNLLKTLNFEFTKNNRRKK